MKAKKYLLSLVLAIMAIMGKAQYYVETPEYNIAPKKMIEMRNIMELRDGGIVANMQIFDCDDSSDDCLDYGCMFYKIEYDSVVATITDSVFIEDNDMSYFLLERNPLGDDNVFAKIVRNFDNCRSDLRISFFDDNLNFNPEKEIWVPISDTLISSGSDDYFLDKNGDLLFHYKIKSRKEHHLVKTGLDGTEKAHLVIPFNEAPFNNRIRVGLYNQYPKEYCIYGLYSPSWDNPNADGDDTLCIMVLDTMLNIKRTITHNTPPNGYVFEYGWETYENYRDTSFLVLTKCDTARGVTDSDTTWNYWQGQWGDGIMLGKCGKSDAKCHSAKIYHYPLLYTMYPIGVKKADDGSIYMSFYIYEPNGGCSITESKLSYDLGTIWESTRTGGSQYFDKMVTLENGGVAVGGMNVYYNEDFSAYTLSVFFVIFKDGTFSVPENNAEERPYTFYPNPANEEITLSLSPEVEATMVEIYDIQGRMVRSQKSGFGTISMHGLPSGTYALRVSLKDGKQYTSAVVKK